MEPVGPACVERRLAAIVAADVLSCSRLIEADDEGIFGGLRALRAELIAPPITTEAVRKLGEILQTTARSEIFREYIGSELSESSKKRKKLIRLKTHWSFHTASTHRGRPVKTVGDGRLVEYGGIEDSVRCAMDVQQEIPERYPASGGHLPIDWRSAMRPLRQ